MTFFGPFFLAKTRVWQKMVIAMKTAIKNCVGIHDPKLKSSSDDPKTAILGVDPLPKSGLKQINGGK